MMRLYHYTGSEHVRSIQLNGIKGGGWLMEDDSILRGVQWLTTDNDWNQSWATMNLTHCDRTEYRFTVAIPKAHRNKLMPWWTAARQLGWSAATCEEFARPGHAHWLVFFGDIPRGWLRELEAREPQALLASMPEEGR